MVEKHSYSIDCLAR
ncbi:unnamed protein product [Medioppia subpectinata]|uniref:Uncharacterized protein n=1 Tax=Medioppia subpectinata TaxID=1979941 RepID=A0A7R9QGL7_9ACAR|nr:unnamed protein product [Medioppia subpectinata]CAG2120428.1 unnamed protein product [Medioppia subpectinata]